MPGSQAEALPAMPKGQPPKYLKQGTKAENDILKNKDNLQFIWEGGCFHQANSY